MWERIINKIFSARWLIAVILTVVFAVLAVMEKVTTEFITIYTTIIVFYFSRERGDNNKQ